MFGRNLRELCAPYRSVSELCRNLGINRTQFNRYLSGESFPRPDVLHQICQFFDVDARILLEPLSAMQSQPGVLNHPFLASHVGSNVKSISEDVFPSGFYRFTRQSFIEADLLVVGLIYFFRDGDYTFVRGYEPRRAMRAQGLPSTGSLREYRGVVTRQEDGVAFTVSHRQNMAATYNFLSRIAAFHSNLWLGYSARPARETVTGRRVSRMVYERLSGGHKEAISVARTTGYVAAENVPPSHIKHLLIDTPFT